jgi:hypothetical protein
MGQNNDNTEHGDLQGNQGGYLSKNPKEHERLRQPEEGYAGAFDANVRFRRDEGVAARRVPRKPK